MFIFALTQLFCGCSTPPAPHDQFKPEVEHKHVNGSQPIAFFRVIIDIKPGTILGKRYGGFLHSPTATYSWKNGVVMGGLDYGRAATAELRDSGFDVMGGENLVFGDDNSAKARFQLGATIKHLTANSYDPLSGNYYESTLDVEWQLRDTFSQKIVLTTTTSGSVRQAGELNIFVEAFRNALVNLIATSALPDLVAKNAAAEVPDTNSATSIEICSPQSTKPVSLPADLDQVMQGVILIKSGRTLASGFLVSPDGYILTAAHCVAGVNEVQVSLKSGLKLTAKVVRVDEPQDVALIKLDGEGYQYLSLKLNQPTPVGDEIYVIGAPTGEDLAFSVTKGIVSGYRERPGDKSKFIQTDAAINLGNSGGPMLDASGKVIGIVSWKVFGLTVQGLAFGVPLEVAEKRLGIAWVEKAK